MFLVKLGNIPVMSSELWYDETSALIIKSSEMLLFLIDPFYGDSPFDDAF